MRRWRVEAVADWLGWGAGPAAARRDFEPQQTRAREPPRHATDATAAVGRALRDSPPPQPTSSAMAAHSRGTPTLPLNDAVRQPRRRTANPTTSTFAATATQTTP